MDDLTIGTITITKYLSDDAVLVSIEASDPDGDRLPLVDALGMLELAKDSLLHPPDDDGDDE